MFSLKVSGMARILIPVLVGAFITPAALRAQDQVRVDLPLRNRLKHDQRKAAEGAIRKIDGVKECDVGSRKITVLLSPEGRLALSDIEKVLKDIEQDKDKPLTIVREKILLKGKIEITVDAADIDRALVAVRGLSGTTHVESKGSGTIAFEAVSSGVRYTAMVRALRRGLGIDKEKEKDPILDVVWIGPPKEKPTAGDQSNCECAKKMPNCRCGHCTALRAGRRPTEDCDCGKGGGGGG